MSNYDYEQEVVCKHCGKYLFTEQEHNGKWSFKTPPKEDYRYFHDEDMFLCGKCRDKYLIKIGEIVPTTI